MRQDPATLDNLSRAVQESFATQLKKSCRWYLAGEVLQKLGDHTYEVVLLNDDRQPEFHVILKTKKSDFKKTGPAVVCIRPDEAWTTVTTKAGFIEERMILEEAR
ncbi:MAG: hypothetical protein FWD69_10410 [Polyangiaceae bacterium]|nr:hypothetical protein [Polyangiaceae bacterium]